MTTVNLRAEAIAEAERLTRARLAVRESDQSARQRLEPGATWIAMTKRSRAKRALRCRACFVYQAAFQDASGRIVESTLIPILVDLPASMRSCRSRDRRAAIRAWVKAAEIFMADRMAAECAAWRADAVRVTEAFFAARLARERAVREPGAPPKTLAQPGLFDRRDARVRHARACAARDMDHALNERRQQVAAASAIDERPARLLLVLVP